MSDINNLIATHTLAEIKEYVIKNEDNMKDFDMQTITESNLSKFFEAMNTGESEADIDVKILIHNIKNGTAGKNEAKIFLENQIEKFQLGILKFMDCLQYYNNLSFEIKNSSVFKKMMDYLITQNSKIIEQSNIYMQLLSILNTEVTAE